MSQWYDARRQQAKEQKDSVLLKADAAKVEARLAAYLNNNPARNTYLVHGFNVSDGGTSTIDTLIPYLEQQTRESDKVVQIDYGWFGLMSVMFQNKDVAKDLKAQQSKLVHQITMDNYHVTGNGSLSCGYSGEYAIGHSNGCAIILEAAKRGATFKRVLLINPALPCDTMFPPTIGEVLVVYTKHDVPTNAAKWANRIPLLRWAIPDAWGAMGKYGSTAVPENREQEVSIVNLARHDLDGHSALFTTKKLEQHASILLGMLYGTSPLKHINTNPNGGNYDLEVKQPKDKPNFLGGY